MEPDVSAISLLDFKSYAAISDIGYAEALRVFAQHGLVPFSAMSPVEIEPELPAEAIPQTP